MTDVHASRKFPPRSNRYWLTTAIGVLLVAAGLTVFTLIRSRSPSGHVLTIVKPAGGTIVAAGISCGTHGNDCSTKRPTGDVIELTAAADRGFALVGYTGDCAPDGRTVMSSARSCGAVFEAVRSTAAVPAAPAVQPHAPLAPRRVPEPSGTATPSNPAVEASPVGKEVIPPAATNADYAKEMIQQVLREYCTAFEAFDPTAVQRVYPNADVAALRIQLNKSKYKSVRCQFGVPAFTALDATAGTATVRVPLTQTFEHTIGPKPQQVGLTVDMTLNRPNARAAWRIDTISFSEEVTRAGTISPTSPPAVPPQVQTPTTVDIFEKTSAYINQMKAANAVFAVEQEMIVGQPYSVRLQLSQKASVEVLKERVTREVRPDDSRREPSHRSNVIGVGGPVKYGPHMVGHMTASGCSIEALRPEEQTVTLEDEPSWVWRITPQKAQRLKLSVRLDAVVDGTPIVIKVFEENVDVGSRQTSARIQE